MKKRTFEILHRYREHILEREQAAIQDRIAEENLQKARLLQLETRVKDTHEAKSQSTSPVELRTLDEAAAYLHGRMTLAQRALQLAGLARQEAMERTRKCKQEFDQVGRLLDNNRRRALDDGYVAERLQLDDLATARYAVARGEA